MRKLLLAALLLSACKPSEDSRVKAIIGAVLVDGGGGPPISDSVVIVAGSRIRAAGMRATVPIPAGSDKINGAGKFLAPGIIDLNVRIGDGKKEAERILADFLHSGVTTVRHAGAAPDILNAVEKDEREGSFAGPGVFVSPKLPEIDSVSAVERLVTAGASGFTGMVGDTEDIPPALIARLRALRIVFAPALAITPPHKLERSKRNTRKLADGGVLIAVGSGGATHREIELLSESGLSPMEVIVAATQNGARVLGKQGEMGTIQPGRQADLLMLSANPLEDPRNLRKTERILLKGDWLDR